jgi:hypothetical protein
MTIPRNMPRLYRAGCPDPTAPPDACASALASRRATIAQERSDKETAMDDGRPAQASSPTGADEEPRYGLTPLGRALLLDAGGGAEHERGRWQMLRS